ncbi:MAG: sodium:calcium antiporter [Thiobacillus sp.]
MNSMAALLVFIASAVITWIAGIWLTRVTDAIDAKFKLGSAFGGLLILGVITSLTEAVVVITASLNHNYDIVIGTVIGGVAIHTAFLALFDARMKVDQPLTFAAASLTLVLEACMVIIVAVAAILAIRTPAVIQGTNFSLISLLILVFWIFGLWLVYKSRNGLPWRAQAIAANPGRGHHERRLVVNHPTFQGASSLKITSVFILSSIATIGAGYGLAVTGGEVASTLGIGSGLFAATFIAFAGALPNISTGIESIKIGDYKLAMSDIFGANAFMPALLIVADILAGRAVIQSASPADIWFAAMGALLTSVYIIGLIVRHNKQIFKMGYDSLIVLVLYVVGLVMLSVWK